MKIAVAYENGEIYGDFAHCPMFALYEYGEYVYECVKTLTDTSALEVHQAMAEKMKELEVDAVLCGRHFRPGLCRRPWRCPCRGTSKPT